MWRYLFATLFLGLCASHATAQCSTTYRTIESRVARAEAVLLGTISRTARKILVPRDGLSEDGLSRLPDGVAEDTLTVKVRETLKGRAVETATLVTRTFVTDQRHEQWREAETVMLWFLGPEPKPGAVDAEHRPFDALRLGPAVEADRHYQEDAPPLFAKDFTVLKQADDILNRARRFAKAFPKPVKATSIVIPHALAGLCSAPCDANFLVLPVEPALDEIARLLIRSPETFLPGAKDLDTLTRAQLRLGGIDLLRHFPTEENATLLRPLLGDPTVFLHQKADTPEGKPTRTYPLREKTRKVLDDWKVKSAP